MEFREIGAGHESIKTFSRIMNLSPPVAVNTYNDINDKLYEAYLKAAQQSMNNAVNHEKENQIVPDSLVDCTVSLDGSWQRRGYDSQNALVTAILRGKDGNDKCIDFEIMSKKCKACQVWSVKKGTHEYDKWLAEHSPICSINHEGSVGSMELSGTVTIFKQSVAKYNLRYKNYVGDGDTSSFMNVVQSKPYRENFMINKLECIGHVQKRLGSRLRRLVQTYKGKVLS